jgi:hypothetical protein
MVFLASLLLMSALVPASAAHHGDTEEVAEAPAPDPVTLYHTYLVLGQRLNDYAARHPDKVKLEVIGKSVLGLNIYGLEITNRRAEQPLMDDRYRLYFDGSIHSNEQLGMEMAMDIVSFLLDEYHSNATAKWIVDNRRTFVVPLVNPDGNVRDSRRNINDVDLNRNFPHGWGGPGSTARGPAPASEPETRAVMGYLQKVQPHYLNSFHTGVLMLLHPYGNVADPSPDHDLYTRICERLANGMKAANPQDRPVRCGAIHTTIYPASGSTVDYAYVEFGTNSWTYEVDAEQNLLLSLEGIRTRLGEAWVAVEHAFLHVERYGALLEVLELVPRVKDGRLDAVEVTLANAGFGNSSQAKLQLNWPYPPDPERPQVSLDLDPIPAGSQSTFVVPVQGALAIGDSFAFELRYNKTLYKGFSEEVTYVLRAVERDGTVLFENTAPVWFSAPPAKLAPGLEAALLLGAVLALAVTARRRRA